jgi:hypothetical protein
MNKKKLEFINKSNIIHNNIVNDEEFNNTNNILNKNIKKKN